MNKQIFLLFFCITTSIAFSQNTVTGVVLDDANIPVPSAEVKIKDTTIGAVTDFDGNFTLTGIELNQVIQVSYVGFKTAEVVYTGQDSITIKLEVSTEALDEVVVIGYGSSSKRKITGAVSTMRAKMLTVDAPSGAIDIVGTGGDQSGSYNVSTASAIVEPQGLCP